MWIICASFNRDECGGKCGENRTYNRCWHRKPAFENVRDLVEWAISRNAAYGWPISRTLILCGSATEKWIVCFTEFPYPNNRAKVSLQNLLLYSIIHFIDGSVDNSVIFFNLLFNFLAFCILAGRFACAANGKRAESLSGKWTNQVIQIRFDNNRTGKCPLL